MSVQLQSGESLAAQARGLLEGPGNRIAKAANLAALLYMELPAVSWVGFYFIENGELMLGPFQGKPACVTIPLGQGVCGAAARTGLTQRVPDVNAFPGHIACDVDSRSELVIPLRREGAVIGVLDLDSARQDRFSESDQRMLEEIAGIYLRSIG